MMGVEVVDEGGIGLVLLGGGDEYDYCKILFMELIFLYSCYRNHFFKPNLKKIF